MNRNPVMRINVKLELAEAVKERLPENLNMTQFITFLLEDFLKRSSGKTLDSSLDVYSLYLRSNKS